MAFRSLVYAYLLGGVTFIPLILVLIVLYVHYTLPQAGSIKNEFREEPSHLVHDGDEKVVLKTGTDDLEEKFHRKHESDVAAGYFAVCREYVPGGVNGKPPDIKPHAGEAMASESPSVYQTMYRSIFDRVSKPSIEPSKDNVGRTARKANNVFYVVLRHGHLMLYDDIQQLEVRYVISLEYHDVDVYAGGEEVPESELWIKRNAIRLSRKKVLPGDKSTAPPFYLFSENQSEKEDFYFAMLHNMQKSLGDNPPTPQEFENAHIITLLQRLHSSQEQLQTRWLNALLGRVFLAIYKTPDLEALVRQKLTKKIARVKKPDFMTKLALQTIDMGTGAPFFTNPRLKDLTKDGDCTVEADVEYSGNIRVELAATVRIDLGKRLGAREVDIVLAATCKKLQGHVLARIKPPPSNRLWFSFEKVPKVELKIEPVVSSRQLTYGFILRAIESRILEVIGETIVLPFWDDVPFTHTGTESYRGGIWKKDVQQNQSTVIKDETAPDEAEAGSGTNTPTPIIKDDQVSSMPVQTHSGHIGATAAVKKSVASLRDTAMGKSDGSRTPDRSSRSATPRILRAPSFASVADPMVSPNHAPAESTAIDIQASSKRDSMLKDLSTRSLGTSPESESHTPPKDFDAILERERNRTNSMASHLSNNSTKLSRRGTDETDPTLAGSINPGKVNESLDPKRAPLQAEGKVGLATAARNFANSDHQAKLAGIVAARDAAQKWGWGVLARNKQKDEEGKQLTESEQNARVDTSQPMGRGQPLPPPGTPLPRPTKPAASLFSLPKRKPAPLLPERKDGTASLGDSVSDDPPQRSPRPPPSLPDRMRRQSYLQSEHQHDDELLVVEAPRESAPTSPLPGENEHLDDFFGHGEDVPDVKKAAPELPKRGPVESLQEVPAEEPPEYAPPLPSRPVVKEDEDIIR